MEGKGPNPLKPPYTSKYQHAVLALRKRLRRYCGQRKSDESLAQNKTKTKRFSSHSRSDVSQAASLSFRALIPSSSRFPVCSFVVPRRRSLTHSQNLSPFLASLRSFSRSSFSSSTLPQNPINKQTTGLRTHHQSSLPYP
mmetsp:Transcript_27116/g.53267  ORF Transcript_27116/g.53267 Transcript_27116/m.53267 type:complete len:140 (+) Transcript_27116:945-1364(+)